MDAPAPLAHTPLATRHRDQRLAELALAAATAMAALPALAIVAFIIWKGAPALSWTFFTEMPVSGMTKGGIAPAIVGTLWMVGVSLLFSVPVGILAGIYLSEYAGNSRFARVVDLAIVNLAGVPSIVHALFGLGAFVLFLDFGTSILSAGLTLGVMTLPVIITSTKAALQSVPHPFRVACWNLGITRWQTIWHVVLPNALPGILTGVILQVSRAAGETAPVMFTGVVFFKSVERGDLLPYYLNEQCMALSMHLYTISTQVPGVQPSIPFATAVVLLALVVIVNATAISLRVYLRSRKKW